MIRTKNSERTQISRPQPVLRLSLMSVVGLSLFISLSADVGGALAASKETAPKAAKGASATSASVPATWPAKMQALYQTLTSVLTDVSSEKRFNDPVRKAEIEKGAKRLAELAHSLDSKTLGNLDQDPTIHLMAGLLGSETQRAVAALTHGDRGYARNLLRTLPGYCIACHTRNSTGPQFAKLDLEPTSGALSSLEKGEFYSASRQFDRGISEFKKVIVSTRSGSQSQWEWARDWERAVRQALVISVRAKSDPKLALEIVQSVLDTPDAPSFMKEDAKTWKASVLEWQQEASRRVMTEEGFYSEMMRLIAKARETQKYPMDRTADVLYLRSTASAHDLLQAAPHGSHAGEAFLIAGIGYEVLSPLRMESLQNFFYEACIREAPHTPVADTCFRHYEESLFLGYTGSAGTDLPQEQRTHLSELRGLAAALTVAPK